MITDAHAHAMAQSALAHWGDAAMPPRLVKNRENIVFDVVLKTGQRVALRLHRPGYQSRDAIHSELVWAGLLADQGLPVPRPVVAVNGQLTGDADDRVVSCVEWLAGDQIGAAEQPLHGSAADQRALMFDVGALAARLHNATDAAGDAEGYQRVDWDAEGFLGPNPHWGRYWENPTLRDAERATLKAASDLARARLTALRNSADYGVIHADMLRENILRGPAGLSLIDFDDSGRGFRLYDLATALVQSLEEPHLPQIAEGLVAGYRSQRAFDDEAQGHLALFVMLRTFASTGWIISRAAPDDPRLRFYAERALRMAQHVLAGTAPWE
ncbi:phosphotransferase enzyme family protein [Phaeovulum sp.]|uniref:phosphotransferase enzyme family protein n=1 Tax=Phaeovulum sp. TaxID=2934796 RepID=UPI0039E21806